MARNTPTALEAAFLSRALAAIQRTVRAHDEAILNTKVPHNPPRSAPTLQSMLPIRIPNQAQLCESADCSRDPAKRLTYVEVSTEHPDHIMPFEFHSVPMDHQVPSRPPRPTSR